MHPDRDFVNRTNCGFLADASGDRPFSKLWRGMVIQEPFLKYPRVLSIRDLLSITVRICTIMIAVIKSSDCEHAWQPPART